MIVGEVDEAMMMLVGIEVDELTFIEAVVGGAVRG